MSADAKKPFRARLQEDLEARYDKLIRVVEDAMESTKKVWVDCPHCRKRSLIEVPNVADAIKASEFIANQGFGRPGVDGGVGDDDKIVFERVVYMTEESGR